MLKVINKAAHFLPSISLRQSKSLCHSPVEDFWSSQMLSEGSVPTHLGLSPVPSRQLANPRVQLISERSYRARLTLSSSIQSSNLSGHPRCNDHHRHSFARYLNFYDIPSAFLGVRHRHTLDGVAVSNTRDRKACVPICGSITVKTPGYTSSFQALQKRRKSQL